MAFARKNLQDIYDSGSKSLAEIEREVDAKLKQTAETHASKRRNGENGSVTLVEERAHELESDLRDHMTGSIERLQKVMETEVKETEQHLEAVKFDLSSLADKLKNSILELRSSNEENVGHLCAALSDTYEGSVEHTTVELEKQDYASTKHLRAHGTVVMNALQQKLDHSLWESRGEEKQYNSSLFKTFMQKANSIDTHFSTLMQKLSSDFQTHFKILETEALQSEPNLHAASQQLVATIDTHALAIEKDIEDFFKQVMEEHSKNLDSNLSTIAQDLSSVHDGTTERLSDQTRQLSASLVTASGEARETLNTKCTDLRAQVDSQLQTFNSRLDEKLANSQTLKQTLEDEKKALFLEIRKDLASIREGFEGRLTTLTTEAADRVSQLASEAEQEIQEAHDRCEQQLKNDGNAAKSEIDAAITQFIDMLTNTRKSALEQITKSAGGTSETVAPDKKVESSRSPRRSRKKDEAPADSEG